MLRESVIYGRSYALALFAREFIYQSFRPKTDMSIFRGPGSRTISSSQVQNNRIIINEEEWNFIPVTRYAAGMSRSLFFDDETTKKYFGTFCYLEPESTTLLTYKTSLTFFNKTAAMISLDPEWATTVSKGFLENNFNIADHINGVLPADLLMSPMEYYLHNTNKVNLNKRDPYFLRRLRGMTLSAVSALSQEKEYIGQVGRMYAIEDEFDQKRYAFSGIYIP